MHIGFWWGNMKTGNQLEDITIDGTIVLKWNLTLNIPKGGPLRTPEGEFL